MTKNEGVNSVVHAIRLIEQFQNGEGLTASELSRRVGIPRATTYRLLKTLIQNRILVQGEDKKYHLTLRLLELGNAALATPALQQMVDPYLITLTAETGETGHFSILDGYHVGYIAKQESPHPFRMLSYIGWRGPLHATASGKALLAFSLPEFIERALSQKLESYTSQTKTDPVLLRKELHYINVTGWAVDDEELSEGLLCYAVPVFMGRHVGALSVSGPKQRVLQNLSQEKIIHILQETSKSISEGMQNGKQSPFSN